MSSAGPAFNPVPGHLDYPISANIIAGQRRKYRVTLIAGMALVGVGVLGVLSGILVGVLRGFLPFSIVVAVFGLGFLTGGAIVVRLSRVCIARIRTVSAGIEFTLTNGQVRLLSWGDSRFHLELDDLTGVSPSAPERRSRTTDFGLGSQRLGNSTDVPKELYDSLFGLCTSHGLSLQTIRITSGRFIGGVRSVFSRP